MKKILFILLLVAAISSCTSKSVTNNTVHVSKIEHHEIVKIELIGSSHLRVHYWNMDDTTKHVAYVDSYYIDRLKK